MAHNVCIKLSVISHRVLCSMLFFLILCVFSLALLGLRIYLYAQYISSKLASSVVSSCSGSGSSAVTGGGSWDASYVVSISAHFHLNLRHRLGFPKVLEVP